MAYSRHLSVDDLAAAISISFSNLGAHDPDNALAGFAGAAASFEGLLAPLDTAAHALPYLHDLTRAFGDPEILGRNIQEVAEFLRSVHTAGVATALGHIAARTQGGDFQSHATFAAATGAIGQGAEQVTVATLNYDGLIHACFLDQLGTSALCDLAGGWGHQSFEVVEGGTNLWGLPLRNRADFPTGRRIRLLQLHGSLGWLRHLDSGEVWSFDIDALRDCHYWEALMIGKTSWMPVVVLTSADRKGELVSKYPFKLACGAAERALVDADRWLIAGYGFGDEPVNAMLKNAADRRKRLDLRAPKVLVVDFNRDVDVLRRIAENITGFGAGNVAVSVAGVPTACVSQEWQDWSA